MQEEPPGPSNGHVKRRAPESPEEKLATPSKVPKRDTCFPGADTPDRNPKPSSSRQAESSHHEKEKGENQGTKEVRSKTGYSRRSRARGTNEVIPVSPRENEVDAEVEDEVDDDDDEGEEEEEEIGEEDDEEDEEEEEDEDGEEEEEEESSAIVPDQRGSGQANVDANIGQPVASGSVSDADYRAHFHSILLCRSGVLFSDKDKPRKRRLSDSYRPDTTFPPMFFPTPTSHCRFTRRTSYSLDDLREIFPSAKLDYFRLPKAFPRKPVKMEQESATANANTVKLSPSSEATCSGRRQSPPRRCRCPNCDHTFASANLSPLILYPTDRKGQADLTAVHKYSFAARLVKPHPRSYRTFRSGHMQWCRYEDDLMKLPLCLQFEVAFAAPDRHRIKLDIPRATENAPTQIAELGFYFDSKDGILKEQDTKTSGFYYVKERLDKDKRRSRYILAVLGSYNHVSELMVQQNMRIVRKQILKLNGLYDVYSPSIYLSLETGRRDKLIVLVASKRVARPGVWSVRTLLHREGGINTGSMLPYIIQAHREGYSVLVANPNENHFVHPNLVDISHIPRHASPAEHLASLWAEEIIPASYARHVYLVLHETAYQAFFLPLVRERVRKRESPLEMEAAREEFFQQLKEHVRGVATIGAVPQLGMNLAMRPEMVRWMQEHAINFVPSTEPAETFLKRHPFGQINDIRQISAGTKDHDRIPETIRPVVFRFFAAQHRRWQRLSQPESGTSAATESGSSSAV